MGRQLPLYCLDKVGAASTRNRPQQGLQCTYRTDLINDSDFQILSISNKNIKETYLINVYNEKKQESNQKINQYTMNRVLIDLNLPNKAIILTEDINCHYN